MAWLITYSMGHSNEKANKVTAQHPADWLISMHRNYPSETTVIHFAIEITEAQRADMIDII